MTAPAPRAETPWTPTTDPAPQFRRHVDGRVAVQSAPGLRWWVFDDTVTTRQETNEVHTEGWEEAALIPADREALADYIASAFARSCPMWTDPDGPAIARIAADAVLRSGGGPR